MKSFSKSTMHTLKDSHREKAPSNKTPQLLKSMSRDIWVVGTSNQEVLELKKGFQKNKVVTDKTPFFMIGPFCTPHYFSLTLTSDGAVLYGNDAFAI